MRSRLALVMMGILGAIAGMAFTALSYTRNSRIFYHLASPGISLDLAVGSPYHPYPTLIAPLNAIVYALVCVAALLIVRRISRRRQARSVG